MTYRLEKYKGRFSRYKCPKCGQERCFVRYIDESGCYIAQNVGRCNHESGCGYHLTPKQYYENTGNTLPSGKTRIRVPETETNPDYIPIQYIDESQSEESNLYCFLYKMNPDKAQAVAKAYRLGATKNRSVIYWQIDEKGQCRTGKIMQYDAGTGKRNKTGWGINWVHSKLTKSGKITDFKLSQCLFGLHLVHLPNSTPVMLVESEKTALIMAMFFPQYTWLATGGKSNFSERLLRVIKPMQIIAIPDADGFSKWSEKSKYLNRGGYRITVLDLFKGEDSSRDIADVLLECFNR